MGNSLGGKKTVKIMKISGETFKLKLPVKAGEVVKDYPGHVLLESEAVKHYGTRAKPLEVNQELVGKRLYFLVELPKPPTEKATRRVRSGINMSAKDRLESLMLTRRSVSDLTIISSSSSIVPEENETENANNNNNNNSNNGATRVKMRLPKAEVEKLMKESKDEAELSAKIMDLCMAANNNKGKIIRPVHEIVAHNNEFAQQEHDWNSNSNGFHDTISTRGSTKAREKRRVTFMPINEGEMQIAVASY